MLCDTLYGNQEHNTQVKFLYCRRLQYDMSKISEKELL